MHALSAPFWRESKDGQKTGQFSFLLLRAGSYLLLRDNNTAIGLEDKATDLQADGTVSTTDTPLPTSRRSILATRLATHFIRMVIMKARVMFCVVAK